MASGKVRGWANKNWADEMDVDRTLEDSAQRFDGTVEVRAAGFEVQSSKFGVFQVGSTKRWRHT